MPDPTITLRRADPSDLDRIEALLLANDLPSDDVHDKPDCFYLAFDGEDRIGAGGIEPYGSDGLLRSVVVEASVRGRGYGTALCEKLEARAAAAGVETLYLLTTTAAGFFRRRGYEAVPRERAPTRIRETTEFADLCPASATCMRKTVE